MNAVDQADRTQAETKPCPLPPHGCGEPAGSTCRNLSTGEPLQHLAAHTSRLRAAGVVHAPVDPRALAARGERTPR